MCLNFIYSHGFDAQILGLGKHKLPEIAIDRPARATDLLALPPAVDYKGTIAVIYITPIVRNGITQVLIQSEKFGEVYLLERANTKPTELGCDYYGSP